MKRRWKILIVTGILLVLIAASLTVTMRVQPEREVDTYKKFLRDKAEKLELSEVTPPQIAREENSAEAVEDAFRMFGSNNDLVPDAMQMVAPGKALIAWQQPDVRGWNFTNSWDEFSATVAADQPAVELLHQVLERPVLLFQFDYKDPSKTLFPRLPLMRRATRKLEAAAVLALHNGNYGVAVTNILTSVAFVQKNASEGLEISHMVRVAMISGAIPPTWELLPATNVTEGQLTALQSGWQQLNLLKDAENAFVVERAWSSAEIQKSRSSHEGFKNTYGSMISLSSGGGSSSGDWSEMLDEWTQGPRLAIGEAMWRSSWSYSDELRTLKANQIIIETLRTMQTNRSEFYKADNDAIASRLSSLALTNKSELVEFLRLPDFRWMFYGGYDNALRGTLRMETARRIAIAAIALKRFQLKGGKGPERLGELVPEFIPSVPVDPFDGKPLKYHPNTDGTFVLYSVGEDGVDDGGNPTNTASGDSSLSWQNHKARDWVWPQPATPAEIQYFYEHPRNEW